MVQLFKNYPIAIYVVLILAVCSSVAISFAVKTARASVTGECSNCHTMHNSEDGATLLATPEAYLLSNDCVGCHSSNTDETIINLSTNRIPIVFNTSGYPSQPLAGGNFYNVSQGGAENDVYGHNVLGISGQDNNLASAPGDTQGSCGCHGTLATDDGTHKDRGKRGCEACHQFTKHHGTEPAIGEPETAESGWYRFLGGHNISGRYVEGIEDPDWEQNPSATVHNVYKGTTDPYHNLLFGHGLNDFKSMTAFCTGCHIAFHDYMYSPNASGSMVSPWLRHPSDLALPTTGEYSAYNPLTDYNPLVPVAWVNPAAPATGEAVVMCLSCHRAHGSEYPDMLRWDYNEMVAGTTGTSNGTGCFVCHSKKDG